MNNFMTEPYVTIDKKYFKFLMQQRLYHDFSNVLILNINQEPEFEKIYSYLYFENRGDFISPRKIKVDSEKALENYYKLISKLSNKVYSNYLKLIDLYKTKNYKKLENIILDIDLFNFLKSDSLFLKDQTLY